MATVVRRTKLVNPALRRNWSAKQIRAGFGGKRRKLAARGNRKRSNASHRPRASKAPRANRRRQPAGLRKYWATHSRSRKRRNISGIAVAGLPAGNPHRKHHKRRKNTVAKARSNRRRQPTALARYWAKHRRKNSGTKARSNRKHRARSRKNSSIKTVYRYRTNARKNWRHRPRRRNPMGENTVGLLKTSAYGAAGAVLSRLIPQWVLGGQNTGITGYGANIASGLALAWAANRFIGKGSGNSVLLGAGIALVLRLVQDFAPGMISSYVSAGGLGDAGMGNLVTANYLSPPSYTGQGAMQRVPTAWAPAPAASKAVGMSALPNSYAFSTYGR